MKPALLLALSLLAAPMVPLAQEDGAVSVLVVSGANNHDWEWTHRSLARILEESGRFRVDVTLDPAKDLADLDKLRGYGALVLDYNGPRWGEAAEAAFLEAVRGGVGVSVIHAANNAFPGWKEYEEIVGYMWREGTGHGRFHDFEVTVTDRDHPVTRGLGVIRAHPDELYHRMVHMHDAPMRILASAHSSKESGGTGESEPMILVREYGKGRVFHTPLGHVWKGDEGSRRSHHDPQFANLVVRGTEWAATGDVTERPGAPNVLTHWQERVGWRRLFDGQSLAGWHRFGEDGLPESGWSVDDGALHHSAGGGGGDLTTDDRFGDFEFTFDWKVAPGANSGVKYRFEEEGNAPLGPEYQVLDDEGHGDAARPETSAAALYHVFPPQEKNLHGAGRWNAARILSRGDRIEHWLNGGPTVLANVGDGTWNQHVAASKFKDRPGFARAIPSPIALQDHGDDVWFQNLFLRDPENPPGREVTLFDGKTLDGWRQYGDAIWEIEDGELIGRIGGGAQSFLITEQTYSDFVLELELKPELPGNSGIQIRSGENDKGRLVGYQIEIDSSERAWSGGLYYEGRAWIQDLKEKPLARAAFRPGDWNHYRIECVGPTIRTWVNGVPTTDYAEAWESEGVIALQVHSGNNTRVRWRNFRFFDLSGDQ